MGVYKIISVRDTFGVADNEVAHLDSEMVNMDNTNSIVNRRLEYSWMESLNKLLLE